MSVEATEATTLEQVLSYIRPAVRAQRPYHVGTAPNVAVKLNQNESPLDLPAPLLLCVAVYARFEKGARMPWAGEHQAVTRPASFVTEPPLLASVSVLVEI